MALTLNHPLLKEQTVYAFSASIGASPIAAATVAQFRGKVIEVGCVPSGTLTSSNSVAFAINGTAVGGSPFVMVSTGAGIGIATSSQPTGANTVNQGDYITFTPSGGAGAAVPGMFYAVIQAN